MVNCNPETVSTDYDTSDRLYFEPITDEDVQNVIAAETSVAVAGTVVGVIVEPRRPDAAQAGHGLGPQIVLGTRPTRSTSPRTASGGTRCAPSWGSPARRGHGDHCSTRRSAVASRIGYPSRPPELRARWTSHGDRLRRRRALSEATSDARPGRCGSLEREGGVSAERPVLVDRFLEDAVEVDVDALRDRTGEVFVGGVMEHVEEAGVHSGTRRARSHPDALGRRSSIEGYTGRSPRQLSVVGLRERSVRGQRGRQVFVLEANPRASRTVPFVAKATGVPIAKVAARVMVGCDPR